MISVLPDSDEATSTNLVLQNLTVVGDVRSTIFNATVRQEFRNPETEHIEAVYTFPLPSGATLLGFDVEMADKTLEGRVFEKQQAQASYEDALSDGDAAVLLERTDDGHYVLNLGNLAPGETCVVQLQYAQVLHFEKDALRLCLPTLIAPRYGDVAADAGLMPHQVPQNSLFAEYDFSVTLRLHDELATGRIASPSHPISVDRHDTSKSDASGVANAATTATVTLGANAALDRDFVLVIDRLASKGFATCAADLVNPKQMAMFASFCPTVDLKHDKPLNLKVLVDCSGSMSGSSIHAAKNALRYVLGELDEQDFCSLSKFGRSVEHESTVMQQAQASSLAKWQAWVDALEADMGGTEMRNAILKTCEIRSEQASPAQTGYDLLIITDGAISAVDRVVRAAQQSNHRVFVVGIGSSPSAEFLQTLGTSTGGACEFVAGAEHAERSITRMFDRIRSPRITDVTIVWPASVQPTWVSSPDRTVFSGDTTNLYAWLDAESHNQGEEKATVIADGSEGHAAGTGSEELSLVLTGRLHPGQPLVELARARLNPVVSSPHGALSSGVTAATSDEGPASAVQTKDNVVARLVAAARAQASSDIEYQTKLAIDYQLVTAHTNFLVVSRREAMDRATDMPELRVVEQMMPAGFSGTGSLPTVNQCFPMNSVASVMDSLNLPRPSRKVPSSTVMLSIDRGLEHDSGEDNRIFWLGGRAVSYWVRQIEDGTYHLAAVVRTKKDDAYQVVFFKADVVSGRERALMFDLVDAASVDAAIACLSGHGFHEVLPDGLPGFTRKPRFVEIEPTDMGLIYSMGAQ